MKLHRLSCSLALPILLTLAAGPGSAQQLPPPTPSAEKMLQEWEQAQVWPLDLASTPSLGPANAPIQAVEFADYLCPACRNLARAWKTVLPSTEGKLALYFKNFPLDQACNDTLQRTPHPGSCWLALGGICAAEQQKFWPYNEAAFEAGLSEPKASDVAGIAAQAGLDRAAMESCLQSPEAMKKLKAEVAEAAAAGIHGTPVLFLNGKKLPLISYFNVWIEAEAKRLGLPPVAPTH